MKPLKRISIFLLTLVIASHAHAQFGFGGTTIVHTKVKASGNAAACKGQVLDLEFIYDGMQVGKFKNEDDYIAKKIKEYNEKEAGKGDKWAAAWKGDRASRFEPNFIIKFNEMGAKTNTTCQKGANGAKYKVQIKTLFTDPGYNIGISRAPAIINANVNFIEIASGKTIASLEITNCPGQTFGGFDFDTGVRLAECYEKCAKEIMAYGLKKWWK